MKNILLRLAILMLSATSAICRIVQPVHAANIGPDSRYLDVAFVPDAKSLIVSRFDSPNWFLYRISLDGKSKPVRLTTRATGRETSPAVSPDGTIIAYTQNVNYGEQDIWVMNADGSNDHPVTTGANDFSPTFGPDGNMYFLRSTFFGHYSQVARSYPHDFDVYSIEPAGGKPRRFSNCKYYAISGISISADGKTVLLTLPEFGEESIRMFTLANWKELKIVRPVVETKSFRVFSTEFASEPNCLPDGKSMLFKAQSGAGYQIYSCDLNDMAARQLTDVIGEIGSVHPSPDGKKVVFIVGSGDRGSKPSNDLYEMDIDGSNLRRLRFFSSES